MKRKRVYNYSVQLTATALELLRRPSLRPKHLELILDRDRRTIARGIKDGSIPSFRVGATVNIPTSAIIRLLAIDEAALAEAEGPSDGS